ncbi:PREDICTED: C4b-binding protein alpha chain [Elephantulus edwardii]|uniref:C4b-binding protein alpha chain n=1 Tax=Elephantulus edwardii TaxID=28737 RepID=UPI0003F0E202|nr:PREDICTED: C4b-binding protein alpha chain [Elephantulus edwardii]
MHQVNKLLSKSPSWTFHRKEKMGVWSFSELSKVGNPTLFQMILLAALLVTALGDCDPPPDLLFATPVSIVNETKYSVGTILKYNCRPGYSRSSSSTTLICKRGNHWSYDTFCTKKRCRNPGDISNGQVHVKTDFFFGSQIEFSCLEGYILIGPTTSYCDIQDKGVDWSNPLPICVTARCEPPPAINNGKHNGGEDSYTYGSSVTYSCDPNFSLIGKASISCMVENKTIGVWSPSPPTCKKVTCSQPQVPNGKISSGFGPIYRYKDSILFDCQDGYILRGNSLIHCEDDNTWKPSPPTCELNSCVGLPDIPHAYWDNYRLRKGHYAVGTVLTYRCNSGYKPIARPMTMTCQEDLTWTSFKGCEKICCPVPQLKNGKITQEKKSVISDPCDFFFGDSVTYSCHGRFDNTFVSVCQGDGRWNPKTPTCDDSCDFPPIIAHGHYKKTGGYFTYEFTYECDTGYTLVGQPKITCYSSTWSPPAPECKALCRKPEIENGYLSVNKYQYTEGENITIQCNPGYSVVGSQYISCSENKTWSPEVSKCEWNVPEGCDAVLAGRKILQCLPDPQDVKLALEVYKLFLEIEKLEREREETEKTYAQAPLLCAMSPMMHSGFPALCLFGILALLQCPSAQGDCKTPPRIAHGSYKDVSSFLSFTTTVQYKCDTGYVLVGRSKISCTRSVWSSSAPQCKALCLKPEIENGNLSVDKNQYVQSDKVIIQCDPGYKIVGIQNITCTENRTWYPEVPMCEWEVPEGCEQVVAGRNLMQYLPSPEDVKTALEMYKLSLEIEQLEKERGLKRSID